MAVRFVVHSAPAVAAAIALGISDVLAKLILAAQGGVLTTLAFRSVVGLAFVTTWLYVGRRPRADARVRFISFGTGILFAGLIFCLFKAIEAIEKSKLLGVVFNQASMLNVDYSHYYGRYTGKKGSKKEKEADQVKAASA